MAKTSYKNCWWLIQIIDGDFGPGSYREGTGYSMRNINDFRPIGERIDWITSHERDMIIDEDTLQNKEAFRQAIMRLRAIIYNEFGLAIMQESTSGPDHHGNGGYYYYLVNPELLDDAGKTLKDHIKFLAESETERGNWVSLKEMNARFKGSSSSMGFISAGGPSSFGYLSKENTSYRTILGEDNLELIQFAMQFGEVLTIKYGKVRTGVDINAPYSFEPYQLKEIEGRWYVIGNLYPLGHKELAEIAVYDLARLEFADEENPDVLYEPVKGFDVNNKETWADICRINKRYLEGAYFIFGNGVHAIDIMTHTEEFAKYLSEYPLCSAQEVIPSGKYRIYTRLTTDLFVMLGAYGAELSFNVIQKDEDSLPPEIIEAQLNYFRQTGDLTTIFPKE